MSPPEASPADPHAAFERLFRAEHAALHRYARFLTGSNPAADDLVQEAFVRLWEMREALDEDRSVRALLFRIVRNEAYNHNRNQRRRAALLREGADLLPAFSPVNPESQLAAAHLGARLRRWIGLLPERQREALLLTRYGGLSHHEAAEAMGISSRTVNNHLVRALEALRDRIRAYDPDLLGPPA